MSNLSPTTSRTHGPYRNVLPLRVTRSPVSPPYAILPHVPANPQPPMQIPSYLRGNPPPYAHMHRIKEPYPTSRTTAQTTEGLWAVMLTELYRRTLQLHSDSHYSSSPPKSPVSSEDLEKFIRQNPQLRSDSNSSPPSKIPGS